MAERIRGLLNTIQQILLRPRSVCCHDLTPVMEPVPIFSFNLNTFCPLPTSLIVNTNILIDISPHFAYFVCFFVSNITATFTNLILSIPTVVC